MFRVNYKQSLKDLITFPMPDQRFSNRIFHKMSIHRFLWTYITGASGYFEVRLSHQNIMFTVHAVDLTSVHRSDQNASIRYRIFFYHPVLVFFNQKSLGLGKERETFFC